MNMNQIGWQAAINTVSGMISEMDKFARKCPIGTLDDAERRYMQTWRAELPQTESIVLPLTTGLDATKKAISPTTEVFQLDIVMRKHFISARDTAHDINVLAKSLFNDLNGGDMFSARNIVVLKRDLTYKLIDLPFIHHGGTKQSRRYFDFQELVVEPCQDEARAQAALIEAKLSRRDTASLTELTKRHKDRAERRKNLVTRFNEKYIPPGRKGRKNRKPHDWSDVPHNTRLEQGLFDYLDNGFYELDFLDVPPHPIVAKLKAHLLSLHRTYGEWVHDNPLRLDSLRTNRVSDAENPNLWGTLGIVAGALYFIATHFYKYVAEHVDQYEDLKSDLKRLQDVIKEQGIVHDKSANEDTFIFW